MPWSCLFDTSIHNVDLDRRSNRLSSLPRCVHIEDTPGDWCPDKSDCSFIGQKSLLLSPCRTATPTPSSPSPLSPPSRSIEVKLRKLDFGSFYSENTCILREECEHTKEHSWTTFRRWSSMWKGLVEGGKKDRERGEEEVEWRERKEKKKRSSVGPAKDMIMGMANTISDIFHCCHVGQIIRS